MPDADQTDDPRDRFYDRLTSTPESVRLFFEGIEQHFTERQGTYVYFTRTNGADMRVRLGDGSEPRTPRSSVFAALEWKPDDRLIYGRCKLEPSELSFLGFNERAAPVTKKEPQQSQFWLSQPYWSAGPSEFIELLEAAEKKADRFECWLNGQR
ncbi:MAG: hypothetical protein ACE360_10295 [Hyphomicrobiales bacterium]